jgi:putative ABC transport system permease protein
MVAFLLFTLLRTVSATFNSSGFSMAGIDRLVVSPKYSIIDSLPIRHMQEIGTVDGVKEVTHADWFGGIYKEPINFFPKFPVDPRSYFDLYPEFVIDPVQLDAFELTRTGAVAPASMAEEYGWKIGDRIPIEGDIYPKRDGSRLWEFDLVGIYRSDQKGEDPFQFLFNYDYFDEARQFGYGSVGWFIVRVDDSERAGEIASEIDKLFENSLNPTRTSTEAEQQRQFARQIGDIGLMMSGILGAVFFTILLLTGNTMTQALRERIPELAVLKTFGFTDGSVAVLLLAESVLLCVVSGILGIALAVVVGSFVAPVLEQVIGRFDITWATVLMAIGTSVALGLVVGAVPALAARRLTIVDALRER